MTSGIQPSILCIDDEEAIRSEVCDVLSLRGYECRPANGIGEARKLLLADENIKIVVVDFHMPGMTGVEVIETLTRESGRDLAFVMLTGDDSQDTAIEALRVRTFDFLKKPVDGRRLITVIGRAVEHLKQSRKSVSASKDRVASIKKLRSALAQRNRTLEEKVLRGPSVLSDVAKSALERVISYSVRLQSEMSREPEGGNEPIVDAAIATSAKLIDILGNLDVHDLDRGAIYRDLRPMDIYVLTQRMLPAIEQLAGAKGVEFVSRIPRGLPFICADETRLGRALSEVIAVLIRHLDPKQRIILTGINDKTSVVLTFKAEGLNIPQAFLEPFNQAMFQGSTSEGQVDDEAVRLAAARLVFVFHGGRVHLTQETKDEMRLRLTIPLWDWMNQTGRDSAKVS